MYNKITVNKEGIITENEQGRPESVQEQIAQVELTLPPEVAQELQTLTAGLAQERAAQEASLQRIATMEQSMARLQSLLTKSQAPAHVEPVNSAVAFQPLAEASPSQNTEVGEPPKAQIVPLELTHNLTPKETLTEAVNKLQARLTEAKRISESDPTDAQAKANYEGLKNDEAWAYELWAWRVGYKLDDLQKLQGNEQALKDKIRVWAATLDTKHDLDINRIEWKTLDPGSIQTIKDNAETAKSEFFGTFLPSLGINRVPLKDGQAPPPFDQYTWSGETVKTDRAELAGKVALQGKPKAAMYYYKDEAEPLSKPTEYAGDEFRYAKYEL